MTLDRRSWIRSRVTSFFVSSPPLGLFLLLIFRMRIVIVLILPARIRNIVESGPSRTPVPTTRTDRRGRRSLQRCRLRSAGKQACRLASFGYHLREAQTSFVRSTNIICAKHKHHLCEAQTYTPCSLRREGKRKWEFPIAPDALPFLGTPLVSEREGGRASRKGDAADVSDAA